MMNKIISLTALMLLFMMPGISQEYFLSGKILNDRGESMPGATVQVEQTGQVVVADSEGFYRLKLISGEYTLKVRFVGYSEMVKTLTVNHTMALDLILEPSHLVSKEVIVKGTRAGKNDPVVYSEMDGEAIRSGNQTQDIPYLLELTPSLVATSDAGTGVGYTGLRIRGTDPSRINVTINGIPYNDSESHDVYWVDIPDFASSVESIQVQRGLGTSTNGAAAFGANINIETKTLNPEPYAMIQSSGGSFNTFKSMLAGGTGLIDGQFSFDFRRSSLSTDGYIDRAYAKMNSYYLSGAWYTHKSVLQMTLFRGTELTYQAWGGVPAELLESHRTYNPYTYENEVDDYTQTHYQLHWSYEWSPEWNVNLAAHYTGGAGYYEQYRENEDLVDYALPPVFLERDTIYSTDLVRRKWLDNDFYGLIYNLNYSGDRLDLQFGGGANQYDGDHYGRIIWAQFASTSDPSTNYYFSNGLKNDWNTFVKANYQLIDNLYAYGDLQYRLINYRISGLDDDQRDITQQHQYNFFNPKVGMLFAISPATKIYGSFGVGNREPKRSNFTDATPGLEVKPERMNDYELGTSYRQDQMNIGINLYFMDYTDQLVLTGEINDVGSPIMVNVQDSYRAGIEFEWGMAFGSLIQWQGNLTLSRNRIQDFTEYVDDWDTWGQQVFSLGETHLAFSPEIIGGSRITVRPLHHLELCLDSKYVGSQYMDNTSSLDKMLDSYLVNDLMLSYSPVISGLKKFRIFFQINNLFNELYESNAWVYSYYSEGERNHMIGYYPQAGRNFLAGINLNF